MKNLHTDLALLSMDRFGDQPVSRYFPSGSEFSREWRSPTCPVWRNPTGDHQADAPARSFRKIGCQSGVVASLVFQPRVHRAHEHTIGECGESQIKGSEQVWIFAVFQHNSSGKATVELYGTEVQCNNQSGCMSLHVAYNLKTTIYQSLFTPRAGSCTGHQFPARAHHGQAVILRLRIPVDRNGRQP